MSTPRPEASGSPCRQRKLRLDASRRASEAGFTVIELLVSAAIGLVVLGVMFGAVAVQGRSAASQRGLADAQQTGRHLGEILRQDLRMAGYGMLGVGADADLPPLDYTTSGGTGTLILRGAFSNTVTTLAQSAAAGSNTLVVAPPLAGAFLSGARIVVDSGMYSEVRTLTAVSAAGANISLTLSSPLGRAYPVGPSVSQIEEVTYVLSGGLLTRGGVLLADEVESVALSFVAQDGTVSDVPGDDLRGIVLDLTVAQPDALPDSGPPRTRVRTEAQVRNLAFRQGIA